MVKRILIDVDAEDFLDFIIEPKDFLMMTLLTAVNFEELMGELFRGQFLACGNRF